MGSEGGHTRRRRRRRVSVPVGNDDTSFLRRLAAETGLSVAGVTRLLLRRGISAYRKDGKLSEC
jgi:hypothetical protein